MNYNKTEILNVYNIYILYETILILNLLFYTNINKNIKSDYENNL